MNPARLRRIAGASLGLAALLAWAAPTPSCADDLPEIQLTNGRYEPSELIVPAGQPFKVRVSNRTDEAIEFESFELHRERVVPPGQTIEVSFPSLSPGSYEFFDDFHDSVEHGAIVVK